MNHYSCIREDGSVRPLVELAIFCRDAIDAAREDGVTVDDGNVVDLIADNSDASLWDIRCALVISGRAGEFPKATNGNYNFSDLECYRKVQTPEAHKL